MLPQAILLVDDDEDYLELARRVLHRDGGGLDVRVTRSGAGALDLLGLGGGAKEPTPGIVAAFVDLNLPGVDGWEVLRRVRADPRLRWLPVVVVSSSARADDVRRSYELGANSYIVKRYDHGGPGPQLLLAMRYWLEVNHPATRVAGVSS